MISHLQFLAGCCLGFWFPGKTCHENYRPEWLHGMELDFYFPELNLAIEVQGPQHHFLCPGLQTIREHQDLRYRDTRKRAICQKRGVLLVSVRYNDKRVIGGLFSKLRSALKIKMKAPPRELSEAWKKHRNTLANNYPRFKIRKSKIIPVNKISAELALRLPII